MIEFYFILIKKMSCNKCNFKLNRGCCSGCEGPRCDNCDPICKKKDCNISVCPTCINKSHFPGMCYSCNSKCWICKWIPYPPCPRLINYIKFEKIVAVICPRHDHELDKIKSFAEEPSESLSEEKIKTELVKYR